MNVKYVECTYVNAYRLLQHWEFACVHTCLQHWESALTVGVVCACVPTALGVCTHCECCVCMRAYSTGSLHSLFLEEDVWCSMSMEHVESQSINRLLEHISHFRRLCHQVDVLWVHHSIHTID